MWPERSNSRQFPAIPLSVLVLRHTDAQRLNDPMVHDVSVPLPPISNGNILLSLNHWFFGVVSFGEGQG
jgi:hypothetical protein